MGVLWAATRCRWGWRAGADTGDGGGLAKLRISPGGIGVCLYLSELLLLLFLDEYAFFSISTTALLIDENRNLML